MMIDKNTYLSTFIKEIPKRRYRNLAWGIFFASIVIFLFLPWKQTIRSSGEMTTLLPEQRPQEIESVIAGRIEKWQVKEGDFVNKGDTILVLSEVKNDYFDPKTIELTRSQITSKESAINSNRDKIIAQDQQINALLQNMELSLDKGLNKIQQNISKLKSDSADLKAIKADMQISKNQLDRNEELYKEGLKSLTDVEAKRLKYQESQAKLQNVLNKILITQSELKNAIIELNSIKADYSDKISKARGERNSTESYVFNAEAELAKINNYVNNLEIRSGFYTIKAPQTGYITKIQQAGIGEIIKEGESVCSIVPLNRDLCAQLYASAIDVPYLKNGSEVRLQFEGYPVLQLSGSKAFAIGTFAGKVYFVEKAANKTGKFRYLVTPKKGSKEWPKSLSLGSGVQSWTMLQSVPIWFELWRQLNSFPPNLTEGELNKLNKKDEGKKND
jgi:multidrug resistance efflux pump